VDDKIMTKFSRWWTGSMRRMLNKVIASAIVISVFLIKPSAAQEITVSFMGDLEGIVGEEVTLSVEVSDLTGLDIPNFDLRFSFDSNLIVFERDQITEGELINSLTANVTDDDRILISYASSSPISGSGVLLEITGTLVGVGSNSEGVIVTELLLGDGSYSVAPEIPYSIKVDSKENTTVLKPPVLLSPANGSLDTDIMPSFEWSEVTGADEYNFTLAEDAFFNDTIIDSSGILVEMYQQLQSLGEEQDYFWRVRSISGDQTSDWSSDYTFTTGVVTSLEGGQNSPKTFYLSKNYPNPFNPTTTINYYLPFESNVQIDLYNVSGKKLEALERDSKQAGVYDLNVDLSEYTSGSYMITLNADSKAGRFMRTQIITLIK